MSSSGKSPTDYARELNVLIQAEPGKKMQIIQEFYARMVTAKEKETADLVLTIRSMMEAGQNQGAKTWEKIVAVVLGVIFVCVLLVIAIFIPRPTQFQIFVFRVVLALAAAGLGAVIPGLIHVQAGPFIRAGGAIALFVVVFWFNPPQLLASNDPPDELWTDHKSGSFNIQITEPVSGKTVSRDVLVKGQGFPSNADHLWLFVKSGNRWWPQAEIQRNNRDWQGCVTLGENNTSDLGSRFTIAAVTVTESNQLLLEKDIANVPPDIPEHERKEEVVVTKGPGHSECPYKSAANNNSAGSANQTKAISKPKWCSGAYVERQCVYDMSFARKQAGEVNREFPFTQLPANAHVKFEFVGNIYASDYPNDDKVDFGTTISKTGRCDNQTKKNGQCGKNHIAGTPLSKVHLVEEGYADNAGVFAFTFAMQTCVDPAGKRDGVCTSDDGKIIVSLLKREAN